MTTSKSITEHFPMHFTFQIKNLTLNTNFEVLEYQLQLLLSARLA